MEIVLALVIAAVFVVTGVLIWKAPGYEDSRDDDPWP